MNKLDELRIRWFDAFHHVDTRVIVRLAQLQVVGVNKSLGTMYSPTLPKSMHALFKHLGSARLLNRTFIDVGCGKGLPLMVAACYPFKKIVGIEFSDELQKRAERNIKEYRGSRVCKDLQVLCLDAMEYRFPPGPLTVYFFNPFQKPIMEQVLHHLAAALEEEDREITVICDTLHDHALVLECLNPQKRDTFLGFSLYSELKPPGRGSQRRGSQPSASEALPQAIA